MRTGRSVVGKALLALCAHCGLPAGGLEAAAPLDASFPEETGATRTDAAASAADAGAGSDALPMTDVALASDAVPEASPPPIDAANDAPAPCIPIDAGLLGPLALATFRTVNGATYDENGDNILTLTNSDTLQRAAAWYPTPLPPLSAYSLTWSFRVGPNDVSGEGIAFAVLVSDGTPGVGDDGNGLGLRNIIGPDGGVPSGYAVEVVMYQNTTDPTNVSTTTLKIAAMPTFTPVAYVAVPTLLNDGNVYSVDVSWQAPSSLAAVLHGPNGVSYPVSSSDPRLVAPSGYFGFTAATGGISDSHNEIAGIAFESVCH